MTFVGIRYRITSGIRIRGVIGIRIGDRRIPVTRGIIRVVDVRVAGRVMVAGTIIHRVVMDAMDAMDVTGAMDATGVMDVTGSTRRGVV
jgi:hypothetical protein